MLFIATAILSAPISVALFDTKAYSATIQLSALNIILLNIFGYLTVVLRFNNKPLLYAGIVGIQFGITAIVSIVLIVSYNKGISAFFIGQIAGLLAGSILLVFHFRRIIIPVIQIKIIKEFFHYSLPQVPAVAGNWLNSYANRFVMIGYLTINDVGIYTVALKIASIFNLVDNAFRMAWEPFIWEKLKSPEHIELLRRISTLITIIVFFISLVFILFSSELLFILSTDQYKGSIPITQILFYAFAFPVLVHVFGIGTSIAKKTIFNTLSFFAGTACNIGLLLVLVPHFGLIAVPLCLAISNILIFSLMSFFAERQYFIGFDFSKQVFITVIFTLLVYLIFECQPDFITKLFVCTVFLIVILFKWQYIYQLLLNDIDISNTRK